MKIFTEGARRKPSPYRYSLEEITAALKKNDDLARIARGLKVSASELKENIRVELEHGNRGPHGSTLDVLPDDVRGRDRLSSLIKIVLSHMSENRKYYPLLKKHVEG